MIYGVALRSTLRKQFRHLNGLAIVSKGKSRRESRRLFWLCGRVFVRALLILVRGWQRPCSLCCTLYNGGYEAVRWFARQKNSGHSFPSLGFVCDEPFFSGRRSGGRPRHPSLGARAPHRRRTAWRYVAHRSSDLRHRQQYRLHLHRRRAVSRVHRCDHRHDHMDRAGQLE